MYFTLVEKRTGTSTWSAYDCHSERHKHTWPKTHRHNYRLSIFGHSIWLSLAALASTISMPKFLRRAFAYCVCVFCVRHAMTDDLRSFHSITYLSAGSRRLPPPARPEDLREIERQNTITAQILENFLERRLFPNKKPTHRLPTLDEILPQPATTSTTELPAWLQKKRNRNGTKSSHSAKATAASTSSFDVVDLNGDLNDGDVGDLDQSYEDDVDEEVVSEEERDGDDFGQRDPESLQSVESERVNQYLERFRRRNTEGMLKLSMQSSWQLWGTDCVTYSRVIWTRSFW